MRDLSELQTNFDELKELGFSTPADVAALTFIMANNDGVGLSQVAKAVCPGKTSTAVRILARLSEMSYIESRGEKSYTRYHATTKAKRKFKA